MSPNYLSGLWAPLASTMGNHLWQSTLFASTAGILTVVFRKNQARARYWLWLAASAKFLIPFSLLVAIGSHLPWSRDSAETKAGLYSALEQISLPFIQPTTSPISGPKVAAVSSNLTHVLPPLLASAWLIGFLVVSSLWYVRWRRISAAVREAAPLRQGREWDVLRRIERLRGIRKPIAIFLSRGSLEPGIFGILRPSLLWPEGISAHLEDAHLETILAHELSHVRRRDNLAAAIHMLVEAIFWFYPLVWWLGVRLVNERERACDEEVLSSGAERQVYAESILKICEFCIGSPLACVSGVTGADLKKRIVRIMTKPVGHKLSFGRKILLAALGIAAITVPVVFGVATGSLARAQSPTTDWQTAAGGKVVFAVASVKTNKSGSETSSMNIPIGPGDIYPPNGGIFSGANIPLVSYIYFANKLTGSQLQLLVPYLPDWVIRDRFDIEARAEGNPTKDQMRLMMQSLLQDRFKLAVHYETRQLPVFALVLAKPGITGPKLQTHQDDPPCSTPPSLSALGSGATAPATVIGGFPNACGGIVGMPASAPGRLRAGARNVPIGVLAETLAQMGSLDRAVLDQTGLSGTFDFTFEWTSKHSRSLTTGSDAQVDELSSTFQEDLKEQLGLRLEPQSGSVTVLVIDHVEKPSEN